VAEVRGTVQVGVRDREQGLGLVENEGHASDLLLLERTGLDSHSRFNMGTTN